MKGVEGLKGEEDENTGEENEDWLHRGGLTNKLLS